MLSIEKLEAILPLSDSTIARDLKLNLKRILTEGALSQEEALLALTAVSRTSKHKPLEVFAREQLIQAGFDPTHVQEAYEVSAIMGMLNMYYRFRYMIHDDENYKTAGLRMMSLSRPALGKERFEMLAFAVSVLNGCESCIRSHEKVLRELGLSPDKIHDLVRLAAVTKGLSEL